MIAKLTLSAAALAATLIAAPAMAQIAPPPAALPPGTPLPGAMNPGANGAVNNIRGQWEAARNALLQTRARANAARQAAAQAEAAEAQALMAFDRANNNLLNILLATTNRPPVPAQLLNLPPELPPPNVGGQPPQGQPVPPPRP
jgi:hypothetical protein